MKKILFIAMVLLSSVATYAQQSKGTLTVQPKVGFNIATLTNADNGDSRFGLAAGAEFEYQATDLLSISFGAMYSMQGMKASSDEGNATLKLDYVNIPILANVYVVKGLAVKVGVQPGFMIDKDDAGDAVKTFDFSIPVGLSYEYANVVLDARYNWGVTKVADLGDNSPKNSVFQITLGYKFDL